MERQATTPYEDYLRQSITMEKQRLDALYNEFAKSNSLRKEILKRQIDQTLENIELISKDLEKYRSGLSWLREPSRERDEKAEHLPKLEKEAAAPAPPPPGQPAARPAVSRPVIGKPAGSSPPSSGPNAAAAGTATQSAARPVVGTTSGSRPKIGSPVRIPSAQKPPAAQTRQQKPSQPAVTPVARPRIGTPIGTPVGQSTAQQQASPKTDENAMVSPSGGQAAATSVKRPVIGTPIGKPKPSADAQNQENTADSSTSASG